MKYIIFIAASLFLFSVSAYAHGDDDNKKKKGKIEQTKIADSTDTATTDGHVHEPPEETVPFSTNINPGWNEFPSMHPMVVHFPIVLLLIAFFAQIASFFIWGKELSTVTLVLLAGGAIGAYIASNFAHPHTTELNDVAAQILTLHEDYAGYTKWLSIAALALKIISHYVLKRKLWGEILVVFIMAGSAYSVSQAGHYGAALTHLHGIGVEGKFLENASHDHEH